MTHHGEGPVSMKLPLIILTFCAIFAGFIPFGKYVSSDGKHLNHILILYFQLHLLHSE